MGCLAEWLTQLQTQVEYTLPYPRHGQVEKFPELGHENIVHSKGKAAFLFLEEAKLTPLEQQRGQNAVASVKHHDVDRNWESRNYRETTWLYTLQETEAVATQRHKGAEGERQVALLSKSRRTYDTKLKECADSKTELENALPVVHKKADMLETRVGQRNAASDLNDVSC